MLYTWSILVDGVIKATVRSISEQGAIQQFYMTYGSASRYSGIGLGQIKAVRVN